MLKHPPESGMVMNIIRCLNFMGISNLPSETAIMPEKSKQTDIERVIHFFLNLYRVQLGVAGPDENLVEFRRLQSCDNGVGHTYELSVRQGGNWKSRRITIGPLGADVQSKSRCYKVVYDDILVVKIPPEPVKTFDSYIAGIYAERYIAEKLAPEVTCISPGISAILKKIPRFRDREGLAPEDLEQKYINELLNHPGAQIYLKIGPTFVYFMNLSEYPFFSDLTVPLHAVAGKVQNQIINNPRALWDVDVFTATYGKSNESLFFTINDIYSEYTAGCGQLQKKFNEQSGSITHRMDTGFVRYLAGKPVLPGESGMTDELVNAWSTHLKTIFQNRKTDIDNFKKIVTEHVRQKNFDANRPRFVGIINNILNLLYSLKKKNVAIRDLKPDNILIVGEQKNNAHILSRPSEYALGLIDLETAFDLSGPDYSRQPMLAGTACYATPSHVFENSVLKNLFSDVSGLLIIQDWYAAIGTIFNAVTGNMLFEKTGRLLPEIIRARHQAREEIESLADTFKNSSWVFWRSAADEFYRNIMANAPELKQVSLKIPAGIVGMLCREANRLKADTRAMIVSRIASQTLFKSKKNRRQLAGVSTAVHTRYRNNWEQDINVPQTTPETKTRILAFLQNLIWLKRQLGQEAQIVSMLNHAPIQVTANTLLEIMFAVVFNAMYCPVWTNREPPRITMEM